MGADLTLLKFQANPMAINSRGHIISRIEFCNGSLVSEDGGHLCITICPTIKGIIIRNIFFVLMSR